MLKLPRHFGLRSTLILLVLAPLLIVFGLSGLLVLGKLETQVEARLQEDIALIARTLKEPLGRALERDRQGSVERALQSTFEFGRVYGVYVYDSEGDLVAKADRFSERTEPGLAEVNIRSQEDTADYRSIAGREVYSYFTPLADAGGQVIGMLQVTRRASEIRDYLETLRTNVLLLIAAFGALFLAIIVFGHHVAIGRPLQRLTRTMADVASGNLRARAAPSGPLEIRMLGRRFNSMLDDINERDAALADEREQQLRLEHKLRQSEKYALVGRLASGVAHELGTPLSVVDGHAQRLMRDRRPGSSDHVTLSSIRDAAARMAGIVQQLLGFGRGSSPLPATHSVARLVAFAIADVRSLFESSGTRLSVLAGEEDACLVADESRIREALVHLLKNALHAAPGGEVRIGWHRSNSDIEIYVEDSGSGISEKDRKRIFEPFFTTKPPGEGSGLGLAIVNGIAADYGGEVVAYASQLGGAGFSMEFPLNDDNKGSAAPSTT